MKPINISEIIENLHPNDKAALRGENLTFSIKYLEFKKGQGVVHIEVQLSYYDHWNHKQIKTSPFPKFKDMIEATATVLTILSTIKNT